MLTPQRPILESPRIELRAFALSDVESLALLANDVAIAQNTLSIPYPYDEQHAREWITTQRLLDPREGLSFAVVRKEDSLLCGSVGLRIDDVNSRAEIGFWIGRPFWGRGLCSEAASLVLAYAFENIEVNRVFAFHFGNNEASGRVMRKVGMSPEGLLRQHTKKGEDFLDLQAYGILREDFLERSREKKVNLMTIRFEAAPSEAEQVAASRRSAAARGEGGRSVAEYGKKAHDKVEKTMHERKQGSLRSGSGRKVTSKKQAIAIGLAEARREGGKMPAAKKSSAKKSSAKKSSARKSPAKKSAAKSSAKKSPAKKSAAKSSAKKSSAKKSPAKKSAAKKSPAKKSGSKAAAKKK